MTIYQLECFIAVAEELNFSAAAERLFTTQPAITYQINEYLPLSVGVVEVHVVEGDPVVESAERLRLQRLHDVILRVQYLVDPLHRGHALRDGVPITRDRKSVV